MNTSNDKTTNPLQQAESILKNAEVQLRTLMGEAAVAGNYETLGQLTNWAQAVVSIYKSTSAGTQISTVQQVNRVPVKAYRGAANSPRPRRSTRPAGYPRFSIEGNSLVKSSWSKKQKDEYHHKADRRVVDQLVQALLAVGRNGEVISTDQLFPLSDGTKDFPDYQSYSCLLWLKTIGLVRHLGREGYQIRDPANFQAELEQHWNELPEFGDQ